MDSSKRTFAAATKYLRKIGFDPGCKGYQQLRFAVCEVVKDPSYLDLGITKRLYPAVADKFGSTSECVERNIRALIQRAWMTDPERMASATCFFTGIKRTPTTAYVIASIADAIIVDDITGSADK